MCANGRLYKLHDVEDRQMSDSLSSTIPENETFLMNETYVGASLDRITKLKYPNEIYSFCSIQTFTGERYIVSGVDCIYFQTMNSLERVSYPKNMKPIKKIYNLENYVLGLTEIGELVEICPFVKSIFKLPTNNIPEQLIDDLIVLESNEQYIELLTLSKINAGERTMKILDFPTRECKYELTLPEVAWLVTQPKSSVNMYFVSGTKNPAGFVQQIEMKIITETDPEQRFKKLLLRGHWDEAEKFAKEFDLTMEPLYQARIKKMLLDLNGSHQKPAVFAKNFKNVMEMLSLIEEKDFLMSIRLTEIPDRSSMTTFLEYLLQNIDTNKNVEETNEINELLLRLETLRLIDPEECNMEWMNFLYHRNMARAAMDYFKNDVLLSCLIWSRHSSCIMPKLEILKFRKWVSTIPNTIEPFQIIQWLKHFAPCFLQSYPNEMNMLVDWCIDRTRSLQFSNTWPEIGLEFINNIMGIFTDIQFMFVDIRRSCYSNIEKIQSMIFSLEELSVLKKTYHLTMTLDDYIKESIEETAFRLLQRIQIHNFKKMVNDFLYPIFMERGSSPEASIVRYIKFLSQNKNLGFWQERAVIAIELLHNEENRLQCALQVLKVSSVPWSDAVLPLARLGTSSSHPLANSIFIEYKTQSIKIIKSKYSWPVDFFDLNNDRIKLVFRILKINSPDMIEDIRTLVNSAPDIAEDAYFYLMNRLTGLGSVDALIDLMKTIELEVENFLELYQKTVNNFIKMLDQELVQGQQIEDYLEVVKLIVNRLSSVSDHSLIQSLECLIKDVKNVIMLRREFKFEVNLKELRNKEVKEKLFLYGIQMISKEIREKYNVVSMWSRLDLLCGSLGYQRLTGCFKMCEKLDNLYFTCHIVDSMTETIDEVSLLDVPKIVDLVVLMMVQQIKYYEENLSSVNDIYDPLTFPLAHNILVKCTPQYESSSYTSVQELIRWTSIGKVYYAPDVVEVTRNDRMISKQIFSSKLNGNAESSMKKRESFSIFENFELKAEVKKQDNENTSPVLRCICNSLKLLIYGLNLEIEPFVIFQRFLGDSDEQQIKDDFFASLEHLLKIKQHVPSFKIVQHILRHQKTINQMVMPPQFVSVLNKKIIKYILSQKEPQYMNAFNVLKAEQDREGCFEYLRSSLKNTSQKIAFSTFSEMYSQYVGNTTSEAGERDNRLKMYYYLEICKHDPSIKYRANLEELELNELLKDLKTRVLGVDLLKRLTRDFNWDYQQALVSQIKIILSRQELEFEIKTDVFGKDEVTIKSSVDKIKKLCEPYMCEITNVELLKKKLISFVKEINFYFYEMYLAVLDMLEYLQNLSMDQKIWRNILLLLKHKLTAKRRAVGQFETDYWMKTQPEIGVLPNIAKYRLPFKPLIEEPLENILSEELSAENFEKFISLIQLHATLCEANVTERIEVFGLAACKNSIMEFKNKAEQRDCLGWSLKPINNAFLQSILRLVSFMQDKPKIIAMLYFVANHAPEGCDQVEAAYECYKFALNNEKELNDYPKAADVVNKIKRKYPNTKTQHLLHLYGLTDDKLMQHVENPTELINALYRHDSILLPQKKDINKLCGELAELYGINLAVLQMRLLQKLLAFAHNKGDDGADMDETVYEDYITSSDPDESVSANDENVARAHYILSSWSSSEAMNFLASELTSSSANAENQLQLYECFAKLIDDNSAPYMELINPNEYLLVKCCFYLKQLGMNYTLEKFQALDKVECLKKVWTNHFNNSKALEVMCYICLGFDIHLPQVWNGVLKQMVALNMVSSGTLIKSLNFN